MSFIILWKGFVLVFFLFIFLSSREAGSEVCSQISLPALLPGVVGGAKAHTPPPLLALRLSPSPPRAEQQSEQEG